MSGEKYMFLPLPRKRSYVYTSILVFSEATRTVQKISTHSHGNSEISLFFYSIRTVEF